MAGRIVSEWERRLREVVSHLTSSAREIFGQSEPVTFAPPDQTPQRGSDPAEAHPPGALRSASKGDRLPPRERRGRD